MKLLVLSASTGGGHDMRAYALLDWWMGQGGDGEVYHPLENTFWGYQAGCQLYNIIQKKFPFLHYGYFHFLEYASMHRSSSRIIGAKIFKQKIQAYLPDLIVSTHAHLNHGYFDLSRMDADKPAPFVVYCGELADGHGFSKHWINPEIDLFACPFRESSDAAQSRGMPAEKTLVSGPLLRKAFYSNHLKFDKAEVIRSFGLNPNMPIYLLATGANGVNRHIPTIKSIEQAGINCQILALCGHNQKTFDEIKKLAPYTRARVVPFAYLNDDRILELLTISTWMLARPGAGLTTEAIVTGCPVIFDLSGGCMPQESNNLNFWKSRTGSLLTSSSATSLIKIIQSNIPVPSLRHPLDSSPGLLLDALSQLGEGTYSYDRE